MSKIKVRRFKKKIANNKKKIVFVASFLLLFFIGSSYALLSTTAVISGGARIGAEVENACKLDITTQFEKTNQWQSGGYNYFVYKVTITNNSDMEINGWDFIVKGNNDLDVNYANMEIMKNADNSLTLSNFDWNSTIAPHAKVSYEICFQTIEEEVRFDTFDFNNCSILNTSPGTNNGDKNIELESITLLPAEYTMTVGERVTLQLLKNPIDAYGEFQWSSSNLRTAIVNSHGVVEAIKKGTTTITVTSSNGLVTTSNITVIAGQNTPEEDEPTGLEFAFKNMYSNQNTFQFELEITNATDQTLHSFSFDWDLPVGTTYTFWTNPGVTATGNTFDVSLLWGDLAPGAKTKISGYVTMPKGNQGIKYPTMDFKNIRY